MYPTRKLGELAPLKIVNVQTIQSQIDSYVEDINKVIHSAAIESGCTVGAYSTE